MREEKALPAGLGEISGSTDRARVMAKLARQIGRGRDAIFHGTRHANESLRAGKLICPDRGDCAICFSRSPETAAYFANLRMDDGDRESRAVLVLDRRSLVQNYRLEPFRDDWTEDDRDEREERIVGRDISFRRHLIGIVQDADVAKVLGRLPPDFYSWSRNKISAFDRKALQAGDSLVREGRARVRGIIIEERNRRPDRKFADR
jgi:hypothetical protein